MPSGISSFNPPSLHKFSSTPYQIGTFEGHPMYEVVLNTTCPTTNSQVAILSIVGKTIVKVSGIAKFVSGSIVGWQQLPYRTDVSDPENFFCFWCDSTNLFVHLGATAVKWQGGQPMIVLIRYYTS